MSAIGGIRVARSPVEFREYARAVTRIGQGMSHHPVAQPGGNRVACPGATLDGHLGRVIKTEG